MPMPRRVLAIALVALAGCSGSDDDGSAPAAAAGRASSGAATSGAPAAENHAHIQSAAAWDVLLEIQEAVGQEVMDADGGPVRAEDLIIAMDSAGVPKAQVISAAYLFGFPDFEVEDEEALVRAENDYLSAQVSQYPDRLFGACSVNPLTDYAVAEVHRCADDPGLVGLKLHFANSDVDLRDPDHVARVGAVFEAAGQRDLPIVAHIRTRAPDYGAQDVAVFIEEVLSRAPSLPVQLAHMAGWGGYDEPTDEALGAFIQAFETGALDPDFYTFDLAAVVIPPQRAEPDTAMVRQVTEANLTLSRRIRQVGIERVLFATDWNVIPLAGYVRAVPAVLTLEASEVEDLMDNVGPLIR